VSTPSIGVHLERACTLRVASVPRASDCRSVEAGAKKGSDTRPYGMQEALASALRVVLEQSTLERFSDHDRLVREHDRLRRMLVYQFCVSMELEEVGYVEGEHIPIPRRLPCTLAWNVFYDLFVDHEGPASTTDDLGRTLASLRALQKVCRRQGLPSPSWEQTQGKRHHAFTGEANLPQERLLLHLGLVKADDEDDEWHWEGKWVGQVLTTQGMTVRRVRMLMTATEEGEEEGEEEEEAYTQFPWGVDGDIWR
jgi:hypothetical protein